MRVPLLVLALALVPAAASAGVIVVDPANGPGTDFTSLAAAIAAAGSNDVLLLRSGSYDGSFVVSTQLSIVADAGAVVTITNSAVGGAAGPALQVPSGTGGPTVLRGLRLSTPSGGGVPLVVQGSGPSGSPVFIEECTVPTAGASGVQVDSISPVILSRCSVNGSDGDATPGAGGQPLAIGQAAVALGAGSAAIFGGIFIGGEGLQAGLYGMPPAPTPGQPGAAGVQISNTDNSVKLLSHAICIGGLGGDGAAPGGNCLPPGDGGDGVLALVNGNVHVAGLFGLGDLPGTPAPGCGTTATQGDLLAAVPPAQLPTWLTGNPVNLSVTAVAREEQKVSLLVFDAVDQSVQLLVGFAPAFAYYPNYSGALVVTPEFVINVGAIPFTGSVTIDARVPELGPGVESAFAFIQPFSKDAFGHKTLGVPSVVLMLDRQF